MSGIQGQTGVRGPGYVDPTTGAGGYLIVGVMTYMRECEAGNASIRLGPEHITVGGHAAQPMDMSKYGKWYGAVGSFVYDMVKKANITKNDELARAMLEWSTVALGVTFTVVLGVTLPFTINMILLLVPLGLMFGPGGLTGVLLGSTPFPTFNYFMLGLSIASAIYHTKLAIDPYGEIYLLG
jgi:hypothetical protein